MDLKNAFLKKLIIHYAGNKNNGDPLLLSHQTLTLDDETLQALQDGLLLTFKNNHEYYSFYHPSSLEFNEVYQYCRQLFENGDAFEAASSRIAQHLYDASIHPKIKGGELYVAYFEEVPVEDRMHKAVGLFKTENKSLFLEVQQHKNSIGLQMREGAELAKWDKSCFIIERKKEEGYDVLISDAVNRGEEAQYWKEGFLALTPQKNEYHHTAHLLTLAKQFITEGLDESETSKKDQVELLNRSLDYFKSKETFDIDEFQKEVFVADNLIQSFRHFGSGYIERTDYDIASGFDISADAVKRGSRQYKSVIKLDKNFHIYVHGRTDLLERGTDDDGRKYYKVYYEKEV